MPLQGECLLCGRVVCLYNIPRIIIILLKFVRKSVNLHVFAVLFSTKLLPSLYALIGFGLLITIHEFGHFLFCKLFGIHTPTFSIGMGPTLFQRTFGKTNFRLALIPIGGYVEISGMAEVGQGDQAHALDVSKTSFRTKPYWKKFLVLTGGIMFNLLFAYVAFSTLYFTTGLPIQSEMELVVSKVNKDKGLDLHAGDKILAVNGRILSKKPKKLFGELREIAVQRAEQTDKARGLSMTVRILRDNREMAISIPAELNGKKLHHGLIAGVSFAAKTTKIEYEKLPFIPAIKKGIAKTHEWIGQVLFGLKTLISSRSIKGFGGPVRIVSESFKMAQMGLSLLIVFLAIISINLAVINILPIGALDGGQLLFETIEAIIRRPIPEVIRFSLNLASWVLILGLILMLSYQDILGIFFR